MPPPFKFTLKEYYRRDIGHRQINVSFSWQVLLEPAKTLKCWSFKKQSKAIAHWWSEFTLQTS